MVDDKLFREGATGRNGEKDVSGEETWKVVLEWWIAEPEHMENWLQHQGLAKLQEQTGTGSSQAQRDRVSSKF